MLLRVVIDSHVPLAKSVTVGSLDPSKVTFLGSRSGPSLADCMDNPLTMVTPIEGLTTKPAGALVPESKFKYLVGFPSMALATPSEPGLFAEEAMTGSPGWVTSPGKIVPNNSTSAIWKQQVLGPWVSTTVHR